jgi:hypothetical protein
MNLLGNIIGTSYGPGIVWNGEIKTDYNLAARLPQSYISLLQKYNGITAYHGFFRLFGYKCKVGYSIDFWNKPSLWKFAWKDRCSNFLCFGETAFGDQYAFSLSDLELKKEHVYFLEGFRMTPEKIADNFTSFFNDEFLRNASDPYDHMVKDAYIKFGKIDARDHLTYSPSILLGGQETVDNIQKMPGQTVLIFNGDLALQIEEAKPGQTVLSLHTYQDENGFERLKIIWGK